MKNIIFLSSLLLFSTTYAATGTTLARAGLKDGQERALIEQNFQPEFTLNSFYNDFKFSSSRGDQFNRYFGHTDFNAAGLDFIKFRQIYWGVKAYNVYTKNTLRSNMFNSVNHSYGTVNNTGLYLHLMKIFYVPVREVCLPIFFDVFGSYDNDKYYQSNTVIHEDSTLSAISDFTGNSSVLGARTFFGAGCHDFYLQGNVTYFYSFIRQPKYVVHYPELPISVPALSTKIGTFIEQARLYYKYNECISPFIGVGLIQLASRTFSRPIINPNFVATSALPEILLPRHGYTYGAGVNIVYKKIHITPAYVHWTRGHTFRSDYIGVSVEFTGLELC